MRKRAWPAVALVLSSVAGGQVRISGGMLDNDQHFYQWTLTNEGDVPVQSFEIPHYQGHIPVVPPGWHEEITEKAWYDKKVSVGRYRVTASEGAALKKGQSVTIGLKLHARGAVRQYGDALIGLSNGQTLTIPHVEYPGKHSSWDTMIAPVALGAVVIGLFAYRIYHGRSKIAE